MDFSTIKSTEIPDGGVTKIEASGSVIWELPASYTNRVPTSIDTDGSIYNEVGYKEGYRIRSGGAEAAIEKGVCTGFIPVKAGDVIRLSGWDFDFTTSANAINLSDSAFSNLGQFTSQNVSYGIMESQYSSYGWSSVVQEKTGVYMWVVPPDSNITYIRVSGYSDASALKGADMIVTVNEEITS